MSDQANSNGTAVPEAPASSVEKVLMKDGRTVEFSGAPNAPRARKLLKDTLFEEGSGHPIVRLDFRNGETRLFRIPESLLLKFAAHGAEQKLGDETAGESDVDDMVLAVDALIDRLNKGDWSTKREGGMSGTSVLLKALVEIKMVKDPSLTLEDATQRIKDFLSQRSQAEKVALRNSDAVKPIVERIEAEKLAKSAKVDTGSLLAAL